MSIDNIYTTTHIENVVLKLAARNGTTLRDAPNKQVWFVGLYIASLVCLTATGASVRWMLTLL